MDLLGTTPDICGHGFLSFPQVMSMKRMADECLEAALEWVNQNHGSGVLPRMFYFQLKLNGHMSWPQFRSTSLPTFPRLQGSESGSNQ